MLDLNIIAVAKVLWFLLTYFIIGIWIILGGLAVHEGKIKAIKMFQESLNNDGPMFWWILLNIFWISCTYLLFGAIIR